MFKKRQHFLKYILHALPKSPSGPGLERLRCPYKRFFLVYFKVSVYFSVFTNRQRSFRVGSEASFDIGNILVIYKFIEVIFYFFY